MTPQVFLTTGNLNQLSFVTELRHIASSWLKTKQDPDTSLWSPRGPKSPECRSRRPFGATLPSTGPVHRGTLTSPCSRIRPHHRRSTVSFPSLRSNCCQTEPRFNVSDIESPVKTSSELSKDRLLLNLNPTRRQ